MDPLSHTVRGAHDLRLHVLEWGRRDAEPLLLLHGFGHSARVWDPFVPDLVDRWRVIAPDARGHGDSEHDPEYRYHHAAVARDVEAILDGLDIARAAVVAHSMGGYAAIRFAAHHPQRVSRLVLVDAGAQLSDRAREAAEREPEDASYESAESYAAALARSHPRASREVLRRLAPHWLRPRPDGRLVPRLDPAFLRPRDSARAPAGKRAFDRARWAREETERLWRYLARIRCPTLVVRGERSPMLSAETAARMVHEVMSDAREVCIPGAGHAVMLDAPAPFRTALLAFLK